MIILTKSKFLEAVELSRMILYDYGFMCESRTKSSYFTREGRNKFTFITLMLFMLNFVRKTLQVELDSFFEILDEERTPASKQAFSEGRKKIKPEAFLKLYEAVVEWYYTDTDYKTHMGYRLLAVDASILEINNSQKLRDAYGVSKGSSIELARAKTSCLYDIENGIIVKTFLTRYDSGERGTATQMLQAFQSHLLSNDLLLFDRGYPSFDFYVFLQGLGVKFIIRAPIHYYASSLDPAVSDQLFVHHKPKKRKEIVHLRAIRFPLPSGDEELLITNMEDENVKVTDFKALYFKRWGIETKFDQLKNQLEIQRFTGNTPLTIEQDFYASMYLINMAAILKQEADEIIEKDHRGKKLKYEYKTNHNILIGEMKAHFLRIIMENCLKMREKLYVKLIQLIQRNRIPIRPDRKFERVKGLRANRNALVQKSAI